MFVEDLFSELLPGIFLEEPLDGLFRGATGWFI